MKSEAQRPAISSSCGWMPVVFFPAAVFLAIFLFIPTPAIAQFAIPSPLTLVASPSSPEPGQQVTVQAVTPSFDRYTARFDWTIDGKPRPDLSGFGKNKVELLTGEVGSVIRIAVDVSRPNAAVGVAGGQTSLIIRTANLSLIYSAETLTPRWYRGKALPSPDSVVNIIAIPEFMIDGARVAPENLVYRWGIDDEQNAFAGIGEQIFRVRVSDLPDASHEIRVTVEDINRKIKKEGSYFIGTYAPRLALYSSSPLGGIEFRTANSFASSRRGLFDFVAEAFFFPVASSRELSWNWDIGGIPAAGASDTPHLITVDTQRRTQESLSISATASGANAFASSASNILNFFLQ